MLLNDKNLIAAAAFVALLLSGTANAAKKRALPAAPPAPPVEETIDSVPMPVAPQARPSAVAQYDEVGYAVGYDAQGSRTASGEPFNPGSMNAAHAMLPTPSFVEVTHLGSGKTILVRINDRTGPGDKAQIRLSPAAAHALGGGDGSPFPVRVRRVNPPEQEQVALQAGRPGGDRLPTPEPLLVVLRKKMGLAPKPVVARPAPPVTPKSAPVPARRTSAPVPVRSGVKPKPGAHYDGQLDSERVNQPAPQVATQSPEQDVGFIEEGAGAGPAQNRVPKAMTSAGYFVQIGAFSNSERATALASRAGAQVFPAGNIWRVRVGPFASQREAEAAQQQLRAQGYRDARVTN